MVLSELGRCLRKLGYDARVFFCKEIPIDESSCEELSAIYKKVGPHSLIKSIACTLFPFDFVKRVCHYDDITPRHTIGVRRQWTTRFSKESTLVLYPELVYGNPLGAKNVARWVLLNYKYSKDKKAYKESDLFIGYRDVFKDSPEAAETENIHINLFDSNLYRHTNFGERRGNCYIVRKGESRTDLPVSFDGPIIDGMTEEERVRVFNECEYCYSYDTQTFYSSIAAICGCKSIVVPEPGKTRYDYLSETENSYGIAWDDSEEEISRALNTVPDLLEKIGENQKRNIQEAQKFIEIVEAHFNVKVRKIRDFRLCQQQ